MKCLVKVRLPILTDNDIVDIGWVGAAAKPDLLIMKRLVRIIRDFDAIQ